MRKISCLYWALALMAGACSNDKDGENVSGRQEIQIRYEVNQARMEARSSVSELKADEKVHLYIAKRTEEGTPAVPENEDLCMMTCEDGGVLAFEDGGEHLYPDNLIDLYAFYQEGITTGQGDLTNVAVSVQTDQSAEGAEEESDFLYAEAKEGFGNSTEPINLTFNHQFARLHFTFKTNTPNQVKLEEISDVEIRGAVTDGTFDVKTGAFTLGSTKKNITAYLTGNSDGEATAIIVPQTLKEGATFLFTVGVEKFEYTVPAEEREFKKGTQYNYTVTLDKYAELPQQQVQVASSVGIWGEEKREITMITGETVNVKLSDVAKGVTITKADLYFEGGIVQEEVTVTDNKMEIVYPLLSPEGKVTLKQAHFYTNTGEKFDYYFTEKELKGNGTDVLALTPPEVGDLWMGGVVFVVGEVTGYDEDTAELKTDASGVKAYKGRIIAIHNLEETFALCSFDSRGANTSIGLSDKINGQNNFKKVQGFIRTHNETNDSYPAYDATLKYDDGNWYIPAIYELTHAIINKQVINQTIEGQSGDLIDGTEARYLSSTERSASQIETSNESSITMMTPAPKTSAYLVRLVKTF